MVNLPAAEGVLTCRDETDSPGRTTVSLAGATEITAARAALAGLLGRLSAASGCSWTGYTVTYTTFLADGPAGAERIMRRAVFVFATAVEDQYAVVVLPGVNADFVEDDFSIDTTAAPIAALIRSLIAGIWVNPFGVALTELLSAYLEIDP